MNRIKFTSLESALPTMQLSNVSITVVDTAPKYSDEKSVGLDLYRASLLFYAMESIKENDTCTMSIVGGMLHCGIDNPMLRMGLFETIGSATNTMYPLHVFFITYTEEQLVGMELHKHGINTPISDILAKQKHINDSMESLDIEFTDINYNDSDINDIINKQNKISFGWEDK